MSEKGKLGEKVRQREEHCETWRKSVEKKVRRRNVCGEAEVFRNSGQRRRNVEVRTEGGRQQEALLLILLWNSCGREMSHKARVGLRPRK